MKILYFFCGEGLGHTTRTIAAARELTKKHKVVFASYGYAKSFAESNGLEVIEVPSEVKLVGSEGALDIKKTIYATIKNAHASTILKFRSVIKKEKPDLVISDSFYIPAYIAHLGKIPVWMILNQFNVGDFFKDKGLLIRLTGTTVKKFNNSSLSAMDKILVPDFSPPFTLCEKNLENHGGKYSDKIEFIGPLVRRAKSNPKLKKHTVFVTVRGKGKKREMILKLLRIATRLKSYKFNIITGQGAGIFPKVKNVKLFPVVADPIKMMSESSLVICGGGHSTMMEAISLGKPILSMPDLYQSEQQANAAQLHELGLGAKIDYMTQEEIIEQLIIDFHSNKDAKRKLAELSMLSKKLDGAKKLCEMVDKIRL
ncbi:MAG: glycosyltransferase family protein [Nanoarchaeota archaeon]